MVENSLDSCEVGKILPEIRVQIDAVKGNEEEHIVKITDNGLGVPHTQMPDAFATFLSSTKYVIKQQRGLFGLGGKMVLMYSQVTTQIPYRIASTTKRSKHVFILDLMIDIAKNRPRVIKEKIIKNKNDWRGCIVWFHSFADYHKARSMIVKYLNATIVANPYMNLKFIMEDKTLIDFKRVTKKAPEPSKPVLPHPHGIDAEFLKSLITSSKDTLLSNFLESRFQRIGKETASKFLKYCKIKDKNIHLLKTKEIVNIARKMKAYEQFIGPSVSCLSPITKSAFIAGIKKEYEPSFTYYKDRKGVYGGHPFIVECVVAYGGKIKSTEAKEFVLHRFANKIPLILEYRSDAIYKALKKMDFGYYKIPYEAPVAFFIHICSTKIPWRTAGKEIVAEVPEIDSALHSVLLDCGRNLGMYLSKRRRREFERQRMHRFKLYVPEIAHQISEITGANKDRLQKQMEKLVVKEVE